LYDLTHEGTVLPALSFDMRIRLQIKM
jgi:hypothetical protein